MLILLVEDDIIQSDQICEALEQEFPGGEVELIKTEHEFRARLDNISKRAPDIVIMDEATSALDEESQARMMEFLRSDLVGSTVLSVTHRPGLEEFFDREIGLTREGSAPARTYEKRYQRLRRLWQRVARRPSPASTSEPGPGPGSRAA